MVAIRLLSSSGESGLFSPEMIAAKCAIESLATQVLFLTGFPAPRLLVRFASDLYGAFPVKRLLLGLLTVLCSERERPFFIPSPAIQFPERAEGVKEPERSRC